MFKLRITWIRWILPILLWNQSCLIFTSLLILWAQICKFQWAWHLSRQTTSYIVCGVWLFSGGPSHIIFHWYIIYEKIFLNLSLIPLSHFSGLPIQTIFSVCQKLSLRRWKFRISLIGSDFHIFNLIGQLIQIFHVVQKGVFKFKPQF